MKYILILITSFSFIFANDYYARIEPIYTYTVKSAVSGKVVFVNNNLESKVANKSIVIKIDDNLNVVELKQTKIKKASLEKVLKIQKDILKSFNKVSSKSKLDKDKQKITILNTQANISDLNIKIATLQDIISNKTLSEKNTYISEILVQKGNFINPGTPLYISKDLSKAKLYIYVSFDDVEIIKNKTIYLDGKKTDLKINKIFKTANNKYISSYKVEIIMNNVKEFSKLVKISFK